MSKHLFAVILAVGLAVLAWVGFGFIGSSWLAFAMTGVIAGVYLFGAWELAQFRATTRGLAGAVADTTEPPPSLGAWLEGVPPVLRTAVRSRVEGERTPLPGPALTPYLVGLLVMLGMLGTFLGMVATFKGALFALEGSTDLQAIRAALAAPIKGLGLSFGTSVAGVATSALLGLLSAISRRERLDVARRLDARIAGVLAPFSIAQQRQETFRALQGQARVLPGIVERLDAIMQRMERRSQELDERLLARHAELQRELAQAHAGLADRVGASLEASLAGGAQAAGDTIRPLVESTMARIAQESSRVHEHLRTTAQDQVGQLSRQFGDLAGGVSAQWTAALEQQARTGATLVGGLQETLAAFAGTFEQRSAALLAAVDERAASTHATLASAEQERVQAWTAALEALASRLQGEWRRVGSETVAQQQAVVLALEKTAKQVAERAGEQALRTLGEVDRLVAQSQELVRERRDGEARWVADHGRRMDQLAGVWRAELAALRAQEDERGEAAVARLGELQAGVAQHLATLGAALEAPITRLLQTASEVPQAAAGVIAQLREEMQRVAERDNLALQERTVLLDQLAALLRSLNEASGEQRVAIEAMVASASSVLQQAGASFAQALQAQSTQADGMVAQVTAGAVELSAVAEAFGHGVQAFQASNDKLAESLQRIEASLAKSTARSDEQLAYYVAQAREVIDLSIASQQGLVENLRQLRKADALADTE